MKIRLAIITAAGAALYAAMVAVMDVLQALDRIAYDWEDA